MCFVSSVLYIVFWLPYGTINDNNEQIFQMHN